MALQHTSIDFLKISSDPEITRFIHQMKLKYSPFHSTADIALWSITDREIFYDICAEIPQPSVIQGNQLDYKFPPLSMPVVNASSSPLQPVFIQPTSTPPASSNLPQVASPHSAYASVDSFTPTIQETLARTGLLTLVEGLARYKVPENGRIDVSTTPSGSKKSSNSQKCLCFVSLADRSTRWVRVYSGQSVD